MLNFNNSYIGEPFLVETNGNEIIIAQENSSLNKVVIQIEDVEDLIRKVNRIKNEIIASKVREANEELFS